MANIRNKQSVIKKYLEITTELNLANIKKLYEQKRKILAWKK